jgi:hypothetical protein
LQPNRIFLPWSLEIVPIFIECSRRRSSVPGVLQFTDLFTNWKVKLPCYVRARRAIRMHGSVGSRKGEEDCLARAYLRAPTATCSSRPPFRFATVSLAAAHRASATDGGFFAVSAGCCCQPDTAHGRGRAVDVMMTCSCVAGSLRHRGPNSCA